MNKQRRRLLANQTRKLMSRFHLSLRKKLLAEFNTTLRLVKAQYPSWHHLMDWHKSRVLNILTAELKLAGLTTANQQRDLHLPKNAAGVIERKILSQEEYDARILAWVKKYAALRARVISETTRRRIVNAIARGVEANDDPAAIADRILDEVGGMSDARAETIARTETAVAVSTVKHETMQEIADETGLDFYKIWTATEDERTRDSHLAADGQKRDMDEPFEVGDAELDHPSDPNGPPEEIINCRCVEVYETKAKK